MSSPEFRLRDVEPVHAKLLAKLVLVQDAFRRVAATLHDGKLLPSECGYIDTQLSKAIGWLASCRAIVIEEGTLLPAHFDTGDLVDLDADAPQVHDGAPVSQAKGGAA